MITSTQCLSEDPPKTHLSSKPDENDRNNNACITHPKHKVIGWLRINKTQILPYLQYSNWNHVPFSVSLRTLLDIKKMRNGSVLSSDDHQHIKNAAFKLRMGRDIQPTDVSSEKWAGPIDYMISISQRRDITLKVEELSDSGWISFQSPSHSKPGKRPSSEYSSHSKAVEQPSASVDEFCCTANGFSFSIINNPSSGNEQDPNTSHEDIPTSVPDTSHEDIPTSVPNTSHDDVDIPTSATDNVDIPTSVPDTSHDDEDIPTSVANTSHDDVDIPTSATSQESMTLVTSGSASCASTFNVGEKNTCHIDVDPPASVESAKSIASLSSFSTLSASDFDVGEDDDVICTSYTRGAGLCQIDVEESLNNSASSISLNRVQLDEDTRDEFDTSLHIIDTGTKYVEVTGSGGQNLRIIPARSLTAVEMTDEVILDSSPPGPLNHMGPTRTVVHMGPTRTVVHMGPPELFQCTVNDVKVMTANSHLQMYKYSRCVLREVPFTAIEKKGNKYVLFEALLLLFFRRASPHLSDIVAALKNSGHFRWSECTAREEAGFISIFRINSTNLKCKWLISVEDVENNFDELRQIVRSFLKRKAQEEPEVIVIID